MVVKSGMNKWCLSPLHKSIDHNNVQLEHVEREKCQFRYT